MANFTNVTFVFTVFFLCLVFENISARSVADAADYDDNGDSTSPPPTSSGLKSPTATSLMGRVSGVMMDSVKQQAVETLDGAGDAASSLGRLQSATKSPAVSGGVGGGGGGIAINRFQETKGRTIIAAKRVVDETVHKIQSTVDGIKRTISGDDQDDEGGDRRVSAAFESLLRAVGSEGKAAFAFASDVINETADRAKTAVEKSQRQKAPRQKQ